MFIDYCKTFLEEPGCYKWEEFIEGLEDYSSRDLTNYNNIWIREKKVYQHISGIDILFLLIVEQRQKKI